MKPNFDSRYCPFAPDRRSQLPRELKVGDTIPAAPGPINRALLATVNHRRGALQANAESGRDNAMTYEARKIIAGIAANEHRAGDPFERAKLFLMARGYNVFCLATVGGPDDRWAAGHHRLTRDGLMALARRQGFEARKEPCHDQSRSTGSRRARRRRGP